MGWYSYYDDEDYEDDDYTLSDYETPSDAIVLNGPVQALSRRGPVGQAWWGQQWVAAMERLGGGRLDRGKRYARNGSVRTLEISHGIAYAEVQGSRPKPYRTAVYLQVFKDQEWQQALAALSEQAVYAAKLLAGEMPGDIEAVFQSAGLSLFPRTLKDIVFECSCPDDWGDPCKHAAAVYYLLAEQLDHDPFILFHLRGRTRDQILSALRGYRSAAVNSGEGVPDAPALDADLERFWGGSTTNLIRSAPLQPDQPPLLRQLGNPPGNIAAPLRALYTALSVEAYRWLGLDQNES